MAELLGNKAVGSIVKLNISGVATDFIVVHQGLPSSIYDSSCNGTWLLMKDIYSKMKWDSSDNDYQNSNVHAYLNGTFFNLLDSDIRSAIVQARLPFHEGDGDSGSDRTGSRGLLAKIFLLTIFEVGFTTDSGSEGFLGSGSRLLYFLRGNDSGSNSSRLAKLNGSYAAWWLRSPESGSTSMVWSVNSSGAYSDSYCGNSSGIRPALILPSSIFVSGSGMVTVNSSPTIKSDTANGTDLGEISESIELNYTVNDADGDAVSVKEYLDGTLKRTYTASLGSANTFECVTAENWQIILNGTHTLKVVANDGKANSNAYTVTFNKQVRTASVSLAEPLPADDVIKAAAIAVTGHFPEDSTLTVLVTNNALDDSPVWEDMTASVMNNSNHVFTNQTAENGFAFNFRITATRGVSDEQGYISSIGGAFE